MDIKQLEIAIDISFKLCNDNPNICPHYMTIKKNKQYKKSTFKCDICGKEITIKN